VRAVDNQLDGNIVMRQDNVSDGGDSVMQRRQAVVEMGAPPRTCINRAQDFLRICDAVPHGRNHSVFQQQFNQLVCVFQFRRECKQLDSAVSGGDQFARITHVDGTDCFGILRTAFSDIDEGTLQIDGAGIGSFITVFNQFGKFCGQRNHFVARITHERGQKSGNTVRRQMTAENIDVRIGFQRFCSIIAAPAVNMAVDEAGGGIRIGKVDDMQSRFIQRKCGSASDGNDLFLLAQDSRIRNVDMRCQAVIRQKKSPVFSHKAILSVLITATWHNMTHHTGNFNSTHLKNEEKRVL